ncbi:hypothetical protein DM860_014115 [Cuscuta australis]|uniref:Uncharacterized protein n=1 Tax=Cuscuta australis TaxID=267555 RepID=A0A328DHA0_9ASTE|nr:hypothetical protein DM860_014115 [Cuscuta australis]
MTRPASRLGNAAGGRCLTLSRRENRLHAVGRERNNPGSFGAVGETRLGDSVTTVVPDGVELVRRSIGGQPLVHRKRLLATVLVDSGDGDLDVVTVPAVVRAGPVGGEVHEADRPSQTRAAPAEDVQIPPLEVVVIRAHKPAPGLEVVDPDPIAAGVVESQRDVRIRSGFQD